MHANAFVRAFMRVPIKSVANKNETKLNQRDNNWMHKQSEQSYEKPTEIIFFSFSFFLFFDIANPCTRKLELERPRIYIHIHIHIHVHQTKKVKKKCWHSLDFLTTKLSVCCINCLLLRLLLAFARFFLEGCIFTKWCLPYRTKYIFLFQSMVAAAAAIHPIFNYMNCVMSLYVGWYLRQSTEHRTMHAMF